MKNYRIKEVKKPDGLMKYIVEFRLRRFCGWSKWIGWSSSFKWDTPYEFDTIEEPTKMIDKWNKMAEISSEKSVYHYI